MSTAAERAAARASWPIRKIALAEEGADDDLSSSTTVEERLSMMWPLARDAFPEVPTYTRRDAPGRILRPADR